MVTQLAACAGVLGAVATTYLKTKTIDIGMAGNGAIARAGRDHGAARATSSRGPAWSIGVVAGVIVSLGVYAIDKQLDDPVGALTAHGLCGIWGTLACGLFTLAGAGGVQRRRRGRPRLHGLASRSSATRRSASSSCSRSCSSLSYATFWVIKKTYGLRVTPRRRSAGPRHLRARHVRLPGAVHPGARARGLRCGSAVRRRTARVPPTPRQEVTA